MRFTTQVPAGAFGNLQPGELISWRMRGHVWPAHVVSVVPGEEDGMVQLDVVLEDVLLTPLPFRREAKYPCEPAPRPERVVTGRAA